MTEREIAERLIDGYNIQKEQDNKTTGFGKNIDRPEFKNCNFDLLRKILLNQGFTMDFEKIKNHNFLTIYPDVWQELYKKHII